MTTPELPGYNVIDPELDAPPGPPTPEYKGDMFGTGGDGDSAGTTTDGSGGGGGTGGGGSGSSGGSGSGGSGGGDGTSDYNDADDEARFFGVPGNPMVWKDKDTGQVFLVYMAEGTDPPVPLLYEVGGADSQTGVTDTLQAFFGEGVDIVYDKEFSSSEIDSTGAVKFGTTNNLDEEGGDPWLGFLDRVDRAAETQPWLNDDEVLALFGGAYLEGRELQAWELESTDWWQDHTERERDWLKIAVSDPETAAQRLADDQGFVRDLFAQIGADGNDAGLLDWMANKYTTGAWTESYLKDQVEAVTTGYYDMDEELDSYMQAGDFAGATSQAEHETVRSLWNEWLGPAYQPSEDEVAQWATKIRKSGDGREELVGMLRGQRMALYAAYEDPNLTYQNIAGPWRSEVRQVWGETADETSDFFQKIVRANDYGEAGRLLRTEGLKQGIDKVWSDAAGATGSSVRRAI